MRRGCGFSDKCGGTQPTWPPLLGGQKQVNVSEKSHIPKSSNQNSHSPQMDSGVPATLNPSS